MSLSLFRRWRQTKTDAHAPALSVLPYWPVVTANCPFLARLTPQEQQALQTLCQRFLDEKAINGAAGLELSALMQLSIAAQACLCVLHLGLDMFDDFSEVIVYPGEFRVARETVDDFGVVHDVSGALTGEAVPGGPVIVSWDATPPADDAPVYNVVIHEFAHKLDLADGREADGIPLFHAQRHRELTRRQWSQTLWTTYDDFCTQLDHVEYTMPRNMDPESEDGAAWYAQLPIDAYAAEDCAEFFAVSSESYFLAPERLQRHYPDWFALLDRYYRPAAK